MAKIAKINKTRWHRLLGTLLEQLLTPVGISVQCDVKVMVNPPEADILLLRRETPQWTDEQRERLPDGIRESNAHDILLKFKYTESVNETAFQQAVAYDYFYKSVNRFSDQQVQSFLISAKTPRSTTLEKFAYQQQKHKGIYFTQLPLSRHIILIVLNELSEESHNAWIKCFSSRLLEKQKAFKVIKVGGLRFISEPLERLLSGLWKLWFNYNERFEMSGELTAEKIMEMGKFWGESYLSLLEPEERLAGLGAKERLVGLEAKEIVSVLDHKKILAELGTNERLADLSIEEIEAYLRQAKKQQ